MAATIFQGNTIKLLKNVLQFFSVGGPTIQLSLVDPISTPVNAPQGSILFYSSAAYVQETAGNSAGWKKIVTQG